MKARLRATFTGLRSREGTYTPITATRGRVSRTIPAPRHGNVSAGLLWSTSATGILLATATPRSGPSTLVKTR